MNIDELKDVLSSSEADAWEIRDSVENRWELYFIRHELDQNRAVNVEHLKVKVYKKSDGFLGNAAGEIAPTASREETEKMIKNLILQASYIKNPEYQLNGPVSEDHAFGENSSCDIAETVQDFMSVMRSLPETSDSYINSYEIFSSSKSEHFVTSEGIDVTENYPVSLLEVVVNARKEEHEIELYRLYESGSCDKENLRKELIRTMQYGLDRLEAGPTPLMDKCAVVFSTSDAVELYRYFAENLNAAYVVRKMSDWKPGTAITEHTRGDRISLSARRTIPNSSMNYNYDEEGIPTRDMLLIDRNVPQKYWGSRMYCQYLGIEDNGIVYNWEVSGGTHSDEQIRSGRFMEIVEFSDFQCDVGTGDIFGEIRLGYLHDEDGKTRIITGGSISGTMADFVSSMTMSTEQTQYNNVIIPTLTRLEAVTITGAAD